MSKYKNPLALSNTPQPPLTMWHDMNLLDYFAGQALAGLIAQPETCNVSDTDLAHCAYNAAQAMLEVRKETL